MYLGIGCCQLKEDFLNNCKLSQSEPKANFSQSLGFEVKI